MNIHFDAYQHSLESYQDFIRKYAINGKTINLGVSIGGLQLNGFILFDCESSRFMTQIQISKVDKNCIFFFSKWKDNKYHSEWYEKYSECITFDTEAHYNSSSCACLFEFITDTIQHLKLENSFRDEAIKNFL